MNRLLTLRSAHLLVFLFALSLFSFSQKTISGVIVKVYDGDTYSLKDSMNIYRKIRLDGIDCPDKGQDFYKEARRYAKRLVLNKFVVVEYEREQGSNQLFFGTVYIDSVNVNRQLLKEGYAWYYPFLKKQQEYYDLHQTAQMGKKGLWIKHKPVPPSEWRKKLKKEKQKK